MKETIELIRLLFPDATLEVKTETLETYRYEEDSYIIEIDICKEDSQSRIILKDQVAHKEDFKTRELLGHLPYLRGLAMGKVLDFALEDEKDEIS